MSIKSKAALLIDNNNVITSQSNPDSIDPADDGALRADVIDSSYNEKDGIEVGIQGRDMTIPALYTTTIHNGDLLEDVIQALMDATNATQIAVTGGVQGLPGEFVAIITPDTNQTILVNENTTPYLTYKKLATIKLVNDREAGGLDNGNNWLVQKFTAPSGGQSGVTFTASNLAINILENTLTSSLQRKFRFYIVKDVSGTITTLATSNELTIGSTDPAGKYYFNDFDTSTVSINAGDEIRLEFWNYHDNVGTEGVRLQFINGFLYNELP